MFFGFLHLTSSFHHPQGNEEAEHAVQTVKNQLKKASDPYVVLLNYSSTPLQYSKSYAEIMMNRKLRMWIFSIRQTNFFNEKSIEEHIKADILSKPGRNKIMTNIIGPKNILPSKKDSQSESRHQRSFPLE